VQRLGHVTAGLGAVPRAEGRRNSLAQAPPRNGVVSAAAIANAVFRANLCTAFTMTDSRGADDEHLAAEVSAHKVLKNFSGLDPSTDSPRTTRSGSWVASIIPSSSASAHSQGRSRDSSTSVRNGPKCFFAVRNAGPRCHLRRRRWWLACRRTSDASFASRSPLQSVS